MKQTARCRYSLKWQLVLLVIACWLVPMILIMGAFASYLNNNVKQQVAETLQDAASSAAITTMRSLRGVLSSSRSASYDGWVWDSYAKYRNSQDKQVLYDELGKHLARQYKYDENLLSAILFLADEPGTLYYTFNSREGGLYENIVSYQQSAHQAVQSISQTLDTDIAFCSANNRIYMVRNIVNSSFKPYAVLVLELNKTEVFRGFQNIVWQTGATLYLNGTSVEVFAYRDNLYAGAQLADAVYRSQPQLTEAGSRLIAYGGQHSDSLELLYQVEVDRQGYIRGFANYLWIFYLLIALLLPILALVLLFAYRNIFAPIQLLTGAAQNIQQGKLGYQIEQSAGGIEFYYLIEALNGMSVQLKEQFERIYNEELALRDAKIMALQSQINPHFLNNTLEIINWEARLGNNVKVSNMIESLATMLDAAMDRKSSPTVPLYKEMMYVDAYLYIVTERFGQRLSVHKEVDSSLLQYPVPRLILQPIIENAVEHGMSPHQTCEIIIRAQRQGDHMLLEIENNGPISQSDRDAIQQLLAPDYNASQEGSLRLGIRNINTRLQIIYGPAYGLHIDERRQSTVAYFTIPIQKTSNEYN